MNSEYGDQDQENEEREDSRIYWHRWLGQLFEALLVPVGVSVHTDHPLMSKPPAVDILLMRNDSKGWTEAQKAVLPDGIRDSEAGQILIEFKYTESINENVMKQVISYDYIYKLIQNKKDHEVQTFLLSSKTPLRKTLDHFAFKQTVKKGIYQSDQWVMKNISLLSLNDLSDEEHNAYIKCFASKKNERTAAFKLLKQKGFDTFDEELEFILISLELIILEKGGLAMLLDPKTQTLSEMGRKYKEFVIANATLEERLKGLKPEDILKRFKPEDFLKRLKPEERLKGLNAEERLKGLNAEEIEQVEAYLKLKAKRTKKTKKTKTK